MYSADIWIIVICKMSSLLKLDGRTVRGRLWKELNNSAKALKQGILLSKKMCSHCNETPSADEETIECMSCHSFFHTVCLLKPVNETFLNLIATNPSVIWFCPACVGCKTSDAAADGLDVAGGSDANLGTNVIMQNTLLSFKRDILALVGETIENKFKCFSDIADQHGRSDPHTNPDSVIVNPVEPDSTEVITKSYSTVASNFANAQQRPPNFSHQNETDVTPPAMKPEKHVLLLKPTNEESMSTTAEKKKSLNSVYRAVTDINVEFCSIKKSGVIAMGFPDSDSKKLAEMKINGDSTCSSTFTAESPKKLLPKVTVKGINEILFNSCDHDDRDEMKEVLSKDILKRNQGVQNIIDSDHNEFLKVVTLQKIMPSDNYVSYNAVLKMSCKVRNYIHQNGDKLYISFNRCKVIDRFHVAQCYHCQKPGHYSNSCPDKKEGKLPTCFYCSGSHASKSCPTKHQEQHEQCCANCLKSSNPNLVNGAKTHSAASPNCPIIQSFVKNIKGKTENWKGKNFYR